MTRTISAGALVLAALLSGCSNLGANLGYYAQAVSGHLRVMGAARPIAEVVHDAATDPALKKQLEEVRAIRDFASHDLGLPDNDSYRSYADLGRPFVVWNVFAAPEFSVDAENWCVPLLGCVSYRGFYDHGAAESLARELSAQGFDTYVGGVPAYSTLGYFNDPVLNTFLRFGGVEVARIIFHELAHQLLYVAGDSVFNESFATAVENEGMRRWVAHTANPDLGRAFAEHRRCKAVFVELVTSYRETLRETYARDLAPAAKRRAKAEVMAEMQRSYRDRRAASGCAPAYDKWFDQDINNAKMASLALYTQLLPAFEALLDAEGGDLPRFYRRAVTLAGLPAEQRKAALNQLRQLPMPVARLSPASPQ